MSAWCRSPRAQAHITSIYRKLDVENRTQMAMLGCQLGVERPAHV
ncbi:MAG TPA: hypothetical protein VNA24_32835 [Hyalangium sp.]|nr:hypothetical protein [Hyalangium sp.]